MLAKVALIGRSNVGKSTLFNHMVSSLEERTVVSPSLHTTRDRKKSFVFWNNVDFELIDAPGINVGDAHCASPTHTTQGDLDILEDNVQLQANAALLEADIILFMIDIQSGFLPQDKQIVRKLKALQTTHHKKVILVLNKADTKKYQEEAHAYTAFFGHENTIPLSARSGWNTDMLYDRIASEIKATKFDTTIKEQKAHIFVAIVGKTNTGKSALFNCIAKEKRVVVSNVPHTTRDTINTTITYKGTTITFLDTAGLRRRAKIKRKSIEEISAKKTLAWIKKAQVTLFVIDISKEITAQEARIADILSQHNTGIILVATKWDLIPQKTPKTYETYKKYIEKSLPFLTWAKVKFCSALKNEGITKILDAILEVKEEMNKEISKEDLSALLHQSLKKHLPSRAKGTRHPYVLRLLQRGKNPPVFDLYIKRGASLHSSYLGFLKNILRSAYGFEGAPIFISIKKV